MFENELKELLSVFTKSNFVLYHFYSKGTIDICWRDGADMISVWKKVKIYQGTLCKYIFLHRTISPNILKQIKDDLNYAIEEKEYCIDRTKSAKDLFIQIKKTINLENGYTHYAFDAALGSYLRDNMIVDGLIV